jgi:hypothetical protein
MHSLLPGLGQLQVADMRKQGAACAVDCCKSTCTTGSQSSQRTPCCQAWANCKRHGMSHGANRLQDAPFTSVHPNKVASPSSRTTGCLVLGLGPMQVPDMGHRLQHGQLHAVYGMQICLPLAARVVGGVPTCHRWCQLQAASQQGSQLQVTARV